MDGGWIDRWGEVLNESGRWSLRFLAFRRGWWAGLSPIGGKPHLPNPSGWSWPCIHFDLLTRLFDVYTSHLVSND